eukprot:gene4365-5371_t
MRRVVGPGASPPVVAGRRRRAPAGAPALEPVYGESYEPEIEEEDDVRPVASGFELTPVDPSDGDYIEIGRGVATQGGPEPTWTATMSTFAVASAPVAIKAAWMPTVVPLTRNQVRSAPNASAASS